MTGYNRFICFQKNRIGLSVVYVLDNINRLVFVYLIGKKNQVIQYNRIWNKQNRSTEGCSKLKRSVDMTSSGKNGLNIRTNASPKWDRTRCPEE